MTPKNKLQRTWNEEILALLRYFLSCYLDRGDPGDISEQSGVIFKLGGFRIVTQP
jgi:hypothetical protein